MLAVTWLGMLSEGSWIWLSNWHKLALNMFKGIGSLDQMRSCRAVCAMNERHPFSQVWIQSTPPAQSAQKPCWELRDEEGWCCTKTCFLEVAHEFMLGSSNGYFIRIWKDMVSSGRQYPKSLTWEWETKGKLWGPGLPWVSLSFGHGRIPLEIRAQTEFLSSFNFM